MSRHLPTTIFGFRRDGKDYVRTIDAKTIGAFITEPDGNRVFFQISRKDARLLVRRIERCLEASS